MISKKQLLIAQKISLSLAKSGYFNYIILDNWRGWCLIYDIRKSRLVSKRQALLLIKKYNKYKLAQLKKATKEDKKIFGSSNYLNCRSLYSYKRCYINWFTLKINSIAEAKQELDLLKGFKILYSSSKNKSKIQNNFKRDVIRKALAKCPVERRYYLKQAL